jgi:hypothetical protein
MDKNKMFQELFLQFCKTHPSKSRQANQNITTDFWNSIKDRPNFTQLYDEKVELLKATKPKGTLASFLIKYPQKNSNKAEDPKTGTLFYFQVAI